MRPRGHRARAFRHDPRVIRMRTFSKAYGLAGARIVCHRRARVDHRLSQGPQSLWLKPRGAGEGFGGGADQSYLKEVQTKIAEARRRIAQIAEENGLSTLPSAPISSPLTVAAMALSRRRFSTHWWRGGSSCAPLPPAKPLHRISCSTAEELDHFAAALPKP